MKTKNVEKRIFGEHRTLVGISEIDAKYKYVKLARSLDTFGVHFFLVKVGRLYQFIKNQTKRAVSVISIVTPPHARIHNRTPKSFDFHV